MLSYDVSKASGKQFDVVPMVGVTCTEIWGTLTPVPQRGHLRLKGGFCKNLGQDSYGSANPTVVSGNQAILVGTSGHYTLSDFKTIEGFSLETYSNFNGNTLGTSFSSVGIQVLPQYSLTSGSHASVSVYSGGTSTIVGLTNMTAADVGTNLIFSGAVAHTGNNGNWLISAFISSTSVQVINGGGAVNAEALSWAKADNLTSKWTLSDCRVGLEGLATGYATGIQSVWTLGTGQGYQGTTAVTNGDVRGCHVNLSTTGPDFTLITATGYILGSIDLTGGGALPNVTCFSNTSAESDVSGPFVGFIEGYYYTGTPGTTKTAIPSGVRQTKGMTTAFDGTVADGQPMVFNAATMKTP
jgi:hypothetical protein